MPSPYPHTPDSRNPERSHGFDLARQAMVQNQLRAPGRDIRDPRVLRAMALVPRHAFVPPELQHEAYADHPLPIGFAQTISQPFIVAFMSQALQPLPHERILEIGTGSGYQAAVLAEIVQEVHTCEIIPSLAQQADYTLRHLGIRNVWVHSSDGHDGWPETAPYDAVIVTCAPEHIPAALIHQLADGGRMIIPVGTLEAGQNLILLRKRGSRVESESVLPVRFVPMTGRGHDFQRPPDTLVE